MKSILKTPKDNNRDNQTSITKFHNNYTMINEMMLQTNSLGFSQSQIRHIIDFIKNNKDCYSEKNSTEQLISQRMNFMEDQTQQFRTTNYKTANISDKSYLSNKKQLISEFLGDISSEKKIEEKIHAKLFEKQEDKKEMLKRQFCRNLEINKNKPQQLRKQSKKTSTNKTKTPTKNKSSKQTLKQFEQSKPISPKKNTQKQKPKQIKQKSHEVYVKKPQKSSSPKKLVIDIEIPLMDLEEDDCTPQKQQLLEQINKRIKKLISKSIAKG